MSAPEPCPRIEALSALIDGELGEADRRAVQSHADQCPVCAPVLAGFRRLHLRFAALEATAPAFDLAPEVDRRIDAAVGAHPRGRRPTARPTARTPWWRLAILAPAGAAAVSVGLWLGAALPAAAPGAQATTAQMVPFSTIPAGALCPVPLACGGGAR
jgi:anti-sigma factor RsiW